MTEKIEIYDAHVHYLWHNSLAESCTRFSALRQKGLRGIALIIMGYHLAEAQKCFDFIPLSYHNRIGQHLFTNSTGMDIPSNSNFAGITTVPYLDSRYITENEADLFRFKQAGFRGLKLLYVPDEDKVYGMLGWNKLFSKSGKDFEAVTLRLIQQAVTFGWPVIFHADLRLHEGFSRHVLATYPGHPFIFPHFGFSRKIIAKLIGQFENCYTDFSSLLPFMQKSPTEYKNFIESHAERILFGSDATIDWTDLISKYIAIIQELIHDKVILTKIFRDNFLKIHQKNLLSADNLMDKQDEPTRKASQYTTATGLEPAGQTK